MDNSKKTILIIDDDAGIRQSYTDYLEDLEYNILTAENGRIGLELFAKEQVDLILVDLRMPEVDGLEVLAKVKESSKETPVIVVSGTGVIGDAVEALHKGAWDYLLKPIKNFSVLTHAVDNVLEKAQLQKENQEYREHLELLVEKRTKELETKNKELEISRRQIVGILSQAAEYRDFETANHFRRVSEYSACIAKGLNWAEDKIYIIRLASPVHDIGKIGIPDNILLKKGKLDEKEWKLMKEHCIYGNRILMSNRFIENDELSNNELRKSFNYPDYNYSLIEIAAKIALNHHEYWDGTGYPMGLKGEEIPMEARITAIADVFDALGSRRPYKESWPEDKCLNYIKKQSGKQFDPGIVKVFLDNFEKIRYIREKYKD